MTTIRMEAKAGRYTGFTCKGHTGYEKAGRDIVCAAVSILTTTCVNALESVAGIRPQAEVRDGMMRVTLPDCDSQSAQIILKTMRQGLMDLSAEYPAYVRLIDPDNT